MIKIDVTPQNSQDFLYSNRSNMVIAELPGFEFNMQSWQIPGLQLQSARMETPFSTVKFSGDKITFEELTVSFIVDEKLSNWKALYDWIKGVGFPESHDQYKAKRVAYSDATVFVYSNLNNLLVAVKYHNLHPISLSSIDFSTQDAESVVKTTTVTFEYDYFTFE